MRFIAAWFVVMFFFGLIPTSCLLVWLGRKLRRIDAAMTCAVIGLLAESFFLVNYRQPMFWMILVYGSVIREKESEGRLFS